MTCPFRIVVMGVAGSGKSTLGAALAERLGANFLEGDNFHPASNVEKLAAGEPLSDGDRLPWLVALCEAMRREDRVVVACSALKRAYRDVLRMAGDVRFVDLVVDPEEVRRRLTTRPAHFMGPIMVESQFEALEPPGNDETDVVTVEERLEVASLVDKVEALLADLRIGTSKAPCRSESSYGP